MVQTLKMAADDCTIFLALLDSCLKSTDSVGQGWEYDIILCCSSACRAHCGKTGAEFKTAPLLHNTFNDNKTIYITKENKT